MKIIRSCEKCGAQFQTEPKYIKRGHGRFCSQSCASSRKRPRAKDRVTLNCANCGKEFSRVKSKLLNSKSGIPFCSRPCKDTAQRIGGVSEIQPPHYGNGIFNYREKARRELELTCIGCGYKTHADVLEVHHRDHDRGNNNLKNLAIVCPTCHSEIHHGHRIIPENGGGVDSRNRKTVILQGSPAGPQLAPVKRNVKVKRK